MNILIPGWAWFVGKDLTKRLLDLWHTIIVVDKNDIGFTNKNLTFYQKDLLDYDVKDFIKEKVEVVINCIWRQYVDTKIPYFSRQEFFDSVNVWITKQILAFSQQRKVKKFIFISTDMVYGIPQYLPIDEKHSCNPIGPYWISKLKAENLTQIYSTNYQLKTLIIRPRFIIWKNRWWVIKKLIRIFWLWLPVPFLWNGKNHYQMVSLDDINSFIALSLDSDICWVVNLWSKETISFAEIYAILKNKLNSKSFYFKTSHSINRVIFAAFDFFGIPLLHKEQYAIADKQYLLDTTRAESSWWKPRRSDKESILELTKQYASKVH